MGKAVGGEGSWSRTQRRGCDLGPGCQQDGSRPLHRIPGGEHGQTDNVPLIFLGVIRLTEVTEHRAYSFFSLPLSHNP